MSVRPSTSLNLRLSVPVFLSGDLSCSADTSLSAELLPAPRPRDFSKNYSTIAALRFGRRSTIELPCPGNERSF